MSMNVDIHHLAAAYALDALDPHERAVFEAHYPTCDVCRQDVGEFRATAAGLAAAAATVAPTALKANVMAEIAVTRQMSPRVVDNNVVDMTARRRSMVRLVSAAAALVLLVAGVAVIAGRSDEPTDAVAASLEQLMRRPDARMVDLAPMSSTAQGHVHLVWSPSGREAVLLGDDLAPAGAGKAYELWMIEPDGAVPMSMLDPAADGSMRSVMQVHGDPQQWGISIEPAGGSSVVTGEVLFLGDA